MAKILVSLPDNVKRRVDAWSQTVNKSRSAVIRDILEQQFNIRPSHSTEELEAMVAQIRKAVGTYKPGKVIRAFRDTRGRW